MSSYTRLPYFYGFYGSIIQCMSTIYSCILNVPGCNCKMLSHLHCFVIEFVQKDIDGRY